MAKIIVSSVQQFGIDSIQVNLVKEFDLKYIENFHISIFKLNNGNMTECTDSFLSINESNDFTYIPEVKQFYLKLRPYTHLEAGTYVVKIQHPDEFNVMEDLYENNLSLTYMEDVRVTIKDVTQYSMDTLLIRFEPLENDTDEDTFSRYQSREFMDLVGLSIINLNNDHFSDYFERFTIEEVDAYGGVTRIRTTLRNNRNLPEGLYDFRLTLQLKSITFSLLPAKDNMEKEGRHNLLFMSTVKPEIGSVYLSKNANQQTVLSVLFKSYLELTMFDSAQRIIMRKDTNEDISNYFESRKFSTKTEASGDVKYITRVDIPLYTEFYRLEKGAYQIKFAWDNTIYPTMGYEFEVGWVIPGMEEISIIEDRYLKFDLPRVLDVQTMRKTKLLVELNGERLSDEDVSRTFRSLVFEDEENGLVIEPTYTEDGREISSTYTDDVLALPITNIDEIQEGTYTFILYRGEDGAIYPNIDYDFIGSIDIISELTPKIIEVTQSGLGTLTVVLEKKIPLSELRKCVPRMKYKSMDFDVSDRFDPIEFANIWEPGQTMVDRFYVTTAMFNVEENLEVAFVSAEYLFWLTYREKDLPKYQINIDYMESPHGHIIRAEQISMNTIEIEFNENQTRRMLQQCELQIIRKSADGKGKVDVTDEFESLDVILLPMHPWANIFQIPLQAGKCVCEGRYTIYIKYKKVIDNRQDIIYSHDIEIDYMTDNIPVAKSGTSAKNDKGLMEIQFQFSAYLERGLLNRAILHIIDENGVDIADRFEDREKWQSLKSGDNFLYKAIKVPIKEGMCLERGTYRVILEWDNTVSYLDPLEVSVYMDFVLPIIPITRVTRYDKTTGVVNLYFELDHSLDASFFMNAQRDIFDANGQDHGSGETNYFDTVQEANNVSADMPSTNSFNLNVIDSEEISAGIYQFVFYHVTDGIRESDYMAFLDIKATTFPYFAKAEESGVDRITFTLRTPIPLSVLSRYTMKVTDHHNVDVSSSFLTLPESNDWSTNIMDMISTFDIILKSEAEIGNGAYIFMLYNGDIELDGIMIPNIIYMKGQLAEFRYIEPAAINKLEFKLRSHEAGDLIRSLSFRITDSCGRDVTSKFDLPYNAFQDEEGNFADRVEDFFMNITEPVADGIYTIEFYRMHCGEECVMSSTTQHLYFMSNELPFLYSVNLTKIDEDKEDSDALLMWFSPPLERTLYDNSEFRLETTSNTDETDHFVDESHRFYDMLENGELEGDVVDEIEYIEFLTIPFKNGICTLQQDDYIAWISWLNSETHSYAKYLERKTRLDFILFPVRKIVQTALDTIQIVFKKPVKVNTLLESRIHVDSIMMKETDDGPVAAEVDFSSQFLPLTVSNEENFKDENGEYVEEVTSVYIRMGSTNPDVVVSDILPKATYRFLVAINQTYNERTNMEYAYGGSIAVDFLMSSDLLNCNFAVNQVSFNRLNFEFTKFQLIDFLSNASFYIAYRNSDGDLIDCSGRFLSILESNYYERKGNNNEVEIGYYPTKFDKDLVIDEAHYKIEETPEIDVKIASNMAIPAKRYEVGILYQDKIYFKTEIELTFMTGDHPNISDMEITEDRMLRLHFNPKPDMKLAMESSFNISTFKRYIYTEMPDGSTKTEIDGKPMSDRFGSILDSKIDHEVINEIDFVSSIDVPIHTDAVLPSGKYYIMWDFLNKYFNKIEAIHSLNAVAVGVKSVRTFSQDTIEFVTDGEVKASFVKGLTLAVLDDNGIDVTDKFMTLKESNDIMGLDDEIKTDKFYIKVDDDEIITLNTYHFTLTEEIQDEEDDEDSVFTPLFCFSMTIIYLTTEFPVITKVDNLSLNSFDVVEITNANASDYRGRMILPLSSNDLEHKVELTRENTKDYINTFVKVFEDVNITSLTVLLSDEIEISLLENLQTQIVDGEDNDITDRFRSIAESNNFKPRKVVDYIEIVFPYYREGSTFEEYEFEITKADGTSIEDRFLSIEDGNELEEDEYVNTVRLKVNSDGKNDNEADIVEKWEMIDAEIAIQNEAEMPVLKFDAHIVYKEISTVGKFKIEINRDTTILPDNHRLITKYQNEPGLENSVFIYPFQYSGVFPFLSDQLGSISFVTVDGMDSILVEFTENLPTALFKIVNFALLNEDGDDYGYLFLDIDNSNDFDEIDYIENMEIPNTIRLRLDNGNSLEPGNYTIRFYIDLTTGEDDDNESEEEEEEDPEDTEEVIEGTYDLWTRSVPLPYMIHETGNKITNLEVASYDTLKVSLESPIDVSLLRTLAFDMELDATGEVFDDIFMALEESNYFGQILMLTDSQYLLYSADGSYWDKFNTKVNTVFKDILYDSESQCYFISCGNGNIIRIKGIVDNEDITTITTPAKKSINKMVQFGTNVIMVGNEGIVLIGSIYKGELTLKKVDTPTKETLNDVVRIPTGEIIAIGYKGTILISKNNGETWEKIELGIVSTLQAIAYHEAVFEEEVEEPDPPEEDDTGGVEEPDVPEVVPPEPNKTTKTGLVLAGVNGLLIYTEDLFQTYEQIKTNSTKSFFGVASHDKTIVVVGDAGVVVTLTNTEEDGFDICISDNQAPCILRDVAWCDSKFIACGTNGNWVSSVSGTTWTLNTSTNRYGFKTVHCTPSQYGGRKGNYFYAKLKSRTTLSPIAFYEGEGEPVDSKLFRDWTNDNTKKTHVGDVYKQYEMVDGEVSMKQIWQFLKIYMYNEEGEGEESKIVVGEYYEWRKIENIFNLNVNGYYYGRIRVKNSLDGKYLYSSEEAIGLPYLTSSPGSVTTVELKNPDYEKGTTIQYPFLHVGIEQGDENLLFYSSYEVLRRGYDLATHTGSSVTNCFKPLRQCDYTMASSLRIDGINLYGNPESLHELDTDDGYALRWNWMSLAPEHHDFIENVSLKKVKNLVKSIDRDPDSPNALIVNLEKSLPSDYAIPSSSDSIFELYLYKYPTKIGEVNETNYGAYFKSIDMSMNLTDPEFYENGMIKKLRFELDDNMQIESGKYVLKFYNQAYDLGEEDGIMWYTTTKLHLTQEVTASLPSLKSIRSENYIAVVNPIVEGRSPENYNGFGDPTTNVETRTQFKNWEVLGRDVLNLHVGDIYTDDSDGQRYYFAYDRISGIYYWKKAVGKPYVVITFDNLPEYHNFMANYDHIVLRDTEGIHGNTDLLPNLYGTMDDWVFDTQKISGVTYIRTIYMPIDINYTFPGAKNGYFEMHWRNGCIYEKLIKDKFTLDSYVIQYGNIDCVVPHNTSINNDSERAGLYIQLDQNMLTRTLKDPSLYVEITHSISVVYTNPETGQDVRETVIEDVSDRFEDLTRSNDFDGDYSNHLWMFLDTTHTGNSIETGWYTITITGPKTGDLNLSDDEDEFIMSKTFYTPWLTTNPPRTVTQNTKLDTSGAVPKLIIEFLNVHPALSSCQNFTLNLTNVITGIDFGECFKPATSPDIKFNISEEEDYNDGGEFKVQSIEIPMKNARCLVKGNYDLMFHFHPNSLLDPIPSTKEGTPRIVISCPDTYITRLGKVKAVKTQKKKMILTLEFNAAIRTDAALAASQVGQALGMTSWNAFLKLMNLSMTKGTKKKQGAFKANPKIASPNVTYTLKANKRINPGKWKFAYKYSGKEVIKGKALDFHGIIFNKVGKAGKDKNCWIVTETHDGTEKCKVFKTWEKANKRIKKMKKLNKQQKDQVAICKKCRKKKIIRTSKVKSNLEKYAIPDKKNIKKFVKQLATQYYKKIIAKKMGCKAPCKIRKFTPENGSSSHVYFHCDNYLKKAKLYSWNFQIATMATGFPKTGSKKIYFAVMVRNGEKLPRGFKAGKKGKKTSKYKKYEKKMTKWIKKYKKKVAKCKKCKKREIASKGATKIGWGNAMFPQLVRTHKKIKRKELLKLLKKAFRKKKGMGCKKPGPDFKFVKKNTKFCRLTCKNTKKADKTLKLTGFMGIYRK